MIKLWIWNSATSWWFKHINTLASINGMQNSILCLFFATFDISNPISKWKHESLWTLFVRRVMRSNFNARAKFLAEIFNFIHSKLSLRPGFLDFLQPSEMSPWDWMMQRKRWNVFQTSKSDGSRTKETTIFCFFLVLALTWWQISMWLSLSPNLSLWI